MPDPSPVGALILVACAGLGVDAVVLTGLDGGVLKETFAFNSDPVDSLDGEVAFVLPVAFSADFKGIAGLVSDDSVCAA